MTSINLRNVRSLDGVLRKLQEFAQALNGKMSVGAEAATVATIAGKLVAGDNVILTGTGTAADPYAIEAAGGGGGDANYDGGSAISTFGGTISIDGGSA